MRIVSGDSPQLPTVGSYGLVRILEKEEKPGNRGFSSFFMLFQSPLRELDRKAAAGFQVFYLHLPPQSGENLLHQGKA